MQSFVPVYIILFLFFHIPRGMAQTVNFEDGFEDGNFTSNPAWSGDTGKFTVTGNINHLLQLNSPNTEPAYLSTPSTNISGIWEFYVEFDGFEPSGSNRAEIFLMSDIPDLGHNVNGYAVQVGQSGDDVFRIVRYDNGSESAVVLSDTTIVNSSGGGYRVRVTRSKAGIWRLEVGTGYEGILYDSGNTGDDASHFSSSYFGVLVHYTSSRSDKFLFDFKIDLPPFAITTASAKNTRIDVTLNRAYKQSTIQTTGFSLDNGVGTPDSVGFPDEKTIRLYYNAVPPGNRYTLTITGIEDLNGESLTESSHTFIVPGTHSSGDLIINEFMYDPPAGIAEYVELRNTSPKYLDIKNWRLGDDTSLQTISNETEFIKPYHSLVVSSDTASLFSAFGHRPYVQINSFPALNNTGDAVLIVSGEGETADSLTYSPGWGGSGVALERRSVDAPSLYAENWGDSPHLLGGTPGLANEIDADRKSPALKDIKVAGSNRLRLAFGERVEINSASDIRNYHLSGNPEIESATVLPPDSVTLTLAGPLKNAGSYTLTISGVEDIFGNIATNLDTTFTYYEISEADPGDIFINEFMYEPPPGIPEYIELYNPTFKSLDLKGWTVNDNTGSKKVISSEQHIIPPGGFMIIAPDNTLLNEHPLISIVEMGSNFPVLNNGGDDIVLRDHRGQLMDSLRYTSGWGGTGTAMERRTIEVSGIWQENWGEVSGQTGTPGKLNRIPPDTTAPEVTNLTIPGDTSLQLEFTEKIDHEGASRASNYTIMPKQNIGHILVRDTTVTLFFTGQLHSGQNYQITVENIQDIFGNTMHSSTLDKTFLRFSPARKNDIVINEILFTRENGGDPEFIELFNTTDQNFDLSGWKLGDAAGTTTLDEGIQLRAGEFMVLTDHMGFADNLGNVFYLSGFPSLNDAGDTVYLQTDSDRLVDSLFYRSGWSSADNGVSIERRDPLAASNDPSNWQAHQTSASHSAGKVNSSYQADITPPAVVFSKLLKDGLIEVRFNEFIRLTSELAFHVGEQTLEIASFDPDQGNRLILRQSSSKASGSHTTKLLTINQLTDVRGNLALTTQVPIAHPIERGSVVINEIMYNPINEPDDNLPDQSEYVELRNVKEYAVSLEGLFLHDAPDENGETRALVPVSTDARWIPADGTALIYADEIRGFSESHIADFFTFTENHTSSVIRIDGRTLGLASSGDAVYLADSTGSVIDSVHYDESWQNPNLIDTRGIALERISPAGSGNDPANWGSSTNEKGGTPHAENTLYQVSVHTPSQVGISFTPNPFSPDSDGYHDNLIISYQLDESDYLMKVQIYDRYGRLVRRLADGQPTGFEGTLIWDGRRDDGTKNRIGIYIIVFEAYNSGNGKNQAFKKTVVLARRL